MPNPPPHHGCSPGRDRAQPLKSLKACFILENRFLLCLFLCLYYGGGNTGSASGKGRAWGRMYLFITTVLQTVAWMLFPLETLGLKWKIKGTCCSHEMG